MQRLALVHSPLSVPRSSKKKFILNLNNYRNTHYLVLNKVKINYKAIIYEQVMALPVFNKIAMLYTVYPKTKRLTDIANVCSVHDKFFADALVELGKIPDDNYLFLPEVGYRFGKVDPTNPRVDIEIFTVK